MKPKTRLDNMISKYIDVRPVQWSNKASIDDAMRYSIRWLKKELIKYEKDMEYGYPMKSVIERVCNGKK